MIYLEIITILLLLVVLFRRQTKLSTLRRIEGQLMGLQEDFQTLSAKFDSLDAATQLVADDIAALKQEIADANASSNVDLSGLIAKAEGIEARLRGAVGPNAGSDPEPAPAEG